ncbi:MAG TPA: hypothetical protein VHE79_11385 [Spirochaetia bacterium]
MKMKGIFIMLNAVLGVAFLVIFLTPLFILGTDWFNVFWSRNWPIVIVFVVTLGAVDTYFGLNWKLFTSLEREDWAGVASVLEDRIFHRERIRPSGVRLLLNTYLVTSNTEGILALEAFASKKKPDIIARFSLPFGIPHLLAKDPADPEAFFSGLLTLESVADRDWVAWNHAFSLLQLKKPDEAQKELAALAEKVHEPVLLLLTLYLLDVVARTDVELERTVVARRDALKARHTPATFQKAIEKSSGNMQVIVLSRLLQDAVQWLFAGPEPAAAAVRE